MNLDEAKKAVERIHKLDELMDKAQANPENWKRTLGCPGTRYLPEWESLMAKVAAFYARASKVQAECLAEYELQLANLQ